MCHGSCAPAGLLDESTAGWHLVDDGEPKLWNESCLIDYTDCREW